MTISARLWTLVVASIIAMTILMAFSLNETYQQLILDKEEQLEITSDIIVNESYGNYCGITAESAVPYSDVSRSEFRNVSLRETAPNRISVNDV